MHGEVRVEADDRGVRLLEEETVLLEYRRGVNFGLPTLPRDVWEKIIAWRTPLAVLALFLGVSCGEAGELEEARAYLVETATPGGTMTRQGPELAIERLHPEFAIRLAGAIREAREEGLDNAGVFSAYRPPAFGVGGFRDKFNSLHAYGLAVDMKGIGRARTKEARLWHKIAASHGIVCPYGPYNRAEWNHCQPTRLRMVRRGTDLRNTIAAAGPELLDVMWRVAEPLIVAADSVVPDLSAPKAKKKKAKKTRYAKRKKRTRMAWRKHRRGRG